MIEAKDRAMQFKAELKALLKNGIQKQSQKTLEETGVLTML